MKRFLARATTVIYDELGIFNRFVANRHTWSNLKSKPDHTTLKKCNNERENAHYLNLNKLNTIGLDKDDNEYVGVKIFGGTCG